MKIAVSGANGFVGRSVLSELAANGHVAVPLVRRASDLAGEVITGDLSDGYLSAANIAGCDVIIHLAARTHVMKEMASDPMAEYRRINVEGTDRLLDAAIEAGVRRFVYMSSVKAIGESSLPGQPLGPDTPPRPEDAYGHSKLEAEALIKERCEAAGMEWVIVRPPLVYGPGVKANFERLVAWVHRGIPLPFARIDNRRSFVDVRNLADATVLAATIDAAAGEAFMVCDTTLSTPQLTRAIGTAISRPPRLIPVPPSLLRFAARITGTGPAIDRICGSLELDATQAIDILGWQPRRSFETSLAEIADHMGLGGPGLASGETDQ